MSPSQAGLENRGYARITVQTSGEPTEDPIRKTARDVSGECAKDVRLIVLGTKCMDCVEEGCKCICASKSHSQTETNLERTKRLVYYNSSTNGVTVNCQRNSVNLTGIILIAFCIGAMSVIIDDLKLAPLLSELLWGNADRIWEVDSGSPLESVQEQFSEVGNVVSDTSRSHWTLGTELTFASFGVLVVAAIWGFVAYIKLRHLRKLEASKRHC